VILTVWMIGKHNSPIGISLLRIVLPLALMLGVTAGWLGYYCWRTTGSSVRTPYQVYDQTYGVIPYMVWQHVRPEPQYRHAMMRKLNTDFEMIEYRGLRSPAGHVMKIASAVIFFLGPVLLLPFAGLFSVPLDKFGWRDLSLEARTLLRILIVSWVAAELAVFYSPHYSAPITSLIVALVLLAMRRLWRLSQSGVFLVRAVPVICVVVFALRAFAVPLHISMSEFHTYGLNQFSLSAKGKALRAPIEAELYTIPGDHLVIVRYSPEHDVGLEWVYNDADIDHWRIVWARDMGANEDQKLIEYFKSRKIWLAEPDAVPPRLTVYESRNQIAGETVSVDQPTKSKAAP
jgi:hypothetical protein